MQKWPAGVRGCWDAGSGLTLLILGVEFHQPLRSPRTVAPAQKIWASTTPSKQQLNPSLTQVPGLQEEAREEVRPGLRKHARELLDRDKKKDELDLSFEVEKFSFVQSHSLDLEGMHM